MSSTGDPLARALARVAELEAELRVAEHSARLANEELQHFVYAASHDLQEPLRAITNYSQLLERSYPDDQHAKEFLNFITSGVAAMRHLIENLLVYSRLKQAPLMTSVRLESAIQASLFKLSPIINASGAVVRYVDLPEIIAHEMQLCQLFEQILRNSILFRGPRKPEIEISAEEGDVEGEPVQIVRIKDNGVGIEPQYLLQVVQPFKRLHTKDYPGNGLGLAICEKIMRAHRGHMWLDSDGKSWTTVNLAFPV